MPTPPKSLLVIRLGAMGDLVHAATAVQTIRQAYPDTAIDWLSAPLYMDLLKTFQWNKQPLLRNTLSYDKKEGLPGFFKTLQAIRTHHYDAVVNLHPSLKTQLLSYGSGASQHTSYKKEKLSIQGQAQRSLHRRHAAEDFLQPFLPLFQAGIAIPQALSNTLPPRLLLPESTLTTNTQPQVSLIIGVGQKRGNRGWPLASYAALIRLLLAESNAKILLIGGPEEIESGHSLKSAFPDTDRLENTCGKSPLLETAARLSGSTVVVGGDTGPLHLASCFNVPIIGIFGPTSTLRTGALGPQDLRPHLLPQPDLTCWPCEQPICPLTGSEHLACMHQITPEAVFAQLHPFLSP